MCCFVMNDSTNDSRICENAMGTDFEKREWETPAYEEQNRLLFLRQKRLLDMLFERNAISKVQYEKKALQI